MQERGHEVRAPSCIGVSKYLLGSEQSSNRRNPPHSFRDLAARPDFETFTTTCAPLVRKQLPVPSSGWSAMQKLTSLVRIRVRSRWASMGLEAESGVPCPSTALLTCGRLAARCAAGHQDRTAFVSRSAVFPGRHERPSRTGTIR